ncbi:MAG: VanW family protein [Anaerolineae bacterium]|nr:VanW family protein [Anaerolineae bacterium]
MRRAQRQRQGEEEHSRTPRRTAAVSPPADRHRGGNAWQPHRGAQPPGTVMRDARSGRAGSERRRPYPRRSAWPVTLALLLGAIIVAGVATMLILELWLADRILPGVYVWDVDVGGLTRDEAAAQLIEAFHYPSDRHPTLIYADRSWPVPPEALGTQLDVPATIDAAFAVGHSGPMLTRLEEQLSVLISSRLIMPSFAYNSGTGAMFVSQIARQVNQSLRNATLSLGEDLSVVVSPGQAGIEVDQDATRQALERRMGQLGGGEVTLIVRESEPLLTDLSAAQAEVEHFLSGPVVLTASDAGTWTIERETLAEWLILRPTTGDDGRATLSVALDPARVAQQAAAIAAEVNYSPTDAQFRWDDGAGRLVAVVDSVPGQTLDVTMTVALIQQAAVGDQRAVPLPLIEVRPALATEDAPALGIVELIGEGRTSFAGSSDSRVQNIIVGASQFDGVLIAPGDEFSFNHYLGEVTAEKGYAESIIIWGNTTRADVGGGLCQVSSTAFRAAFWAGLPVTERWPHAFRVSYYEPPLGMDATIYSPQVDLKWVNDAGHYLLIHTYVDTANQTLTFRYYGTNPGYTVEIDGPYESNPVPHGPAVYREDPTLPKGQTKQIEWAKDGLDVTVYRVIKQNGVEVQRDTFFSRYRPWQAVYLVGTRED